MLARNTGWFPRRLCSDSGTESTFRDFIVEHAHSLLVTMESRLLRGSAKKSSKAVPVLDWRNPKWMLRRGPGVRNPRNPRNVLLCYVHTTAIVLCGCIDVFV